MVGSGSPLLRRESLLIDPPFSRGPSTTACFGLVRRVRVLIGPGNIFVTWSDCNKHGGESPRGRVGCKFPGLFQRKGLDLGDFLFL